MKIEHSMARAAGFLESIADDAKKAESAINEMSLSEQCSYLFRVKKQYEDINEQVKKLYRHVDKLSKVIIPEAMDDAGVDKIRVPEVATSFYPLVKYSASMLDKGAGFQYLRDNNAGALITETVNASSLSAYLRDRLVNEGVEPPEDVFKFGIYKITGMSKYTPK